MLKKQQTWPALVALILFSPHSFAKEAKPLPFPDFSDVAPKPISKNTQALQEEIACVSEDGVIHHKGTEGFSECMRPGAVKQSKLNVGKQKTEFQMMTQPKEKKKGPKMKGRVLLHQNDQTTYIPVGETSN